MEKEAAQEFFQWQLHQPLFVLVRRVAPAERDPTICQVHQPVIGDGYAMGVAAEVSQGMLSPTQRALAINHPIGAEYATKHG
jgi:hypothetical protein